MNKINPEVSNVHLCCLQLTSPWSHQFSVLDLFFHYFLLNIHILFLHKKHTVSTTAPCFFHLTRYSGDHFTVMYKEIFCSFSQLHHIPISEGYFNCYQFLLLKTVPLSRVLHIHHFLCSLSLEQIPRNVISWSKWNTW